MISQSGDTEEYKAFAKISDSEKNALDAFRYTVPLALAQTVISPLSICWKNSGLHRFRCLKVLP